MERMKDKKDLYYGTLWPRGGEYDKRTGYAFETEDEREKWLDMYSFEAASGMPVAFRSSYEEMQKHYGNDFCVILDGELAGHVCTRHAALEMQRFGDVAYY